MNASSGAVPAAFDEIAGRYASKAHLFTDAVAARLVELCCLIMGENVLDVGCGAGAVTVRAAKAVAPGGHVTGIDLSARMLEQAAAQAEREGVARYVTLRPGDASSPPGPEGFYTSVLSSLVVYLLPDPAAALAAWRPLIAPGGLLAFSYGTGQDPRWLEVFRAIEEHNPAPAFLSLTSRMPGPDAMHALLRKLGYQAPHIRAETLTTVYTSAEEFWEQSSSQGAWVSWRHMSPGQLEQAKAAATRELKKLAGPDGTLTRRTHIAYATAYQRQAA
jgi:ubiquinone/menaquinone biosynthesis C-methylase UbiE